jgi:hypothetical protein
LVDDGFEAFHAGILLHRQLVLADRAFVGFAQKLRIFQAQIFGGDLEPGGAVGF